MIRPPASTGDAALWYAERGWPIFPLAGKNPAIKGGRGFYDATADRKTIAAWWRLHPGANIGWALWISDALHVVLDDDGGAAEELAATDRPLPATLTQVSRPGRRHYVYVLPPGVEPTGQPDPDLSRPSAQTRVAGFGYIVVEPSRHPCGSTYRWESSLELIAEAPDWLVEHVSAPRPAAAEVEPDRRVLTEADRAWLQTLLDLEPKVWRLFSGRWRDLVTVDRRGKLIPKYRTQSEADFALLAYLINAGADDRRAQRIFRSSGLYRPTRCERGAGPGHTYLTLSIGKLRASRAAEKAEAAA
jgi:hypothetical protein